MLAIKSAAGAESPVDDTAEDHGVPEAVDALEVATKPPAKPDVRTTTPPSLANDGERILDLLDDVQALTWVFAGDNLGFEVQQARRGWIEHFTDFIHEKLARKHDIILSSSFADSTVEHLLKDVEDRILRFQPDVVLVMPSAAECAHRGQDESFREIIHQLVDRLHEEGCTVVLNTPPCPANASHSVAKAMKTAASRIRSVATQNGTIFADHFSHWQATIRHDGSNANLHAEAGEQPSARGHRELARRLLKSLNVRSS
jgi:hypothetical protein